LCAGLAAISLPAAAVPATVDAPTALAPPTIAQCQSRFGATCLTPDLLRRAYGVDSLIDSGVTGAGVTIGIVDSFGSPTLAHDLQVFDETFGLPPIDLEVIAPAGTPPPFNPQDSDMATWAGETTLDVEVAHAIAPGAKIVVIVTPTSETEGLQGFPEIVAAEKAVLSRVDVISQSFAATEPTFSSPDQVRALSASIYPAAKAAGIAILSSSGDSGPTDLSADLKTLYPRPVTVWPASDPLVTAVGGTRLGLGLDGLRNGPDQGWSGAGAGGGGVSEIFDRPAFQANLSGVSGAGRAVPDISLDAAPSTGMLVYSTFSGEQWSPQGGTSHAAPLLAGIIALADQVAKARVGYLNDALYRLAGTADHGSASGIVDVTTGSNSLSRSLVPGYEAVPGYDLATGLGTLNASAFVPAIVAATKGQHQPLAQSGAAPSTSATATAATGAAVVPAVPTAAGRGHAWAGVWRFAVGGVGLVVIIGTIVVLIRRERQERRSRDDTQ